MKLTVIGSSSSGNGYILEHGNEAIIIEAGFPASDVLKKVRYNKVKGLLLTHEHQDHAKHVKTYLDKAITVFSGLGTMQALKLDTHYNFERIQESDVFEVSENIKVFPFSTYHDVAEPLGFLINWKGYGNICFITDSYLMPYNFSNVRMFVVEANYDEYLLSMNEEYYINRVIKSHSSFDNTMEFLEKNVCDKTDNIVLTHLSNGNSNSKQFKKECERAFGVATTIADKGTVVEYF